ncbi:MAG: tetratricopeptide repeat protein, partial [Leptolyngbyaceae cyanobacterium SM2_5_2]|nr:tetratricopeptide repeat protein [Leptolyngbyaceae cyanobacterium SM2_5_2]
MDRTNRTFVQFAQEIQDVRVYVDERIQAAQAPDLSQIHQDIAQLQDQYAYAATSMQNLTTQVQRLATVGRVEATETKLSQLKTDVMQIRVILESLRLETRHTVSNLQDTMAHLERHYQDLPRALHPYPAKTDPADIMRAVANLVSQQEFNNLTEHVKDLARQQANLARDLTKIPVGSVSGLGPSPDAPGYEEMIAELERLGRLIHHLQEQVNRQETAGHTREQVQQMASQYLGQLKAQLSQLEGMTQSLAERQQSLTNQLAVVSPDGQPSLKTRQVLAQMAKRLKQSEAEISILKQARVEATSAADDQTTGTWIIDFPVAANVGSESAKSASRQALELALDQAQRRLLLVWPWASHVTLDDDLLKRFTRLLDRGAHLELGWCHQGDQQDGRLIGRISQRWHTEPTQMTLLKVALNQLLPLREQYPDRFKFKVMGTAESYLICDSGLDGHSADTYAIVSLQNLPTQSVAVPGVDAKLRTSNRRVVEALMQRFYNPTIDPRDAAAFFNRGTTRHDLRDQPGAISDYSQVLALQPDHAIALTNRGAAYLELNQPDEAELDLSEAINQDPRLFAAYCNRGWLRLDQRRYPAAVQDFTKAIDLKPHCLLPTCTGAVR